MEVKQTTEKFRKNSSRVIYMQKNMKLNKEEKWLQEEGGNSAVQLG